MAIESTFQEIALLLVLAAVVGAFAVRLRQPLIVAFIGVGILVGPSALGLITAAEEIDLLAEIGIALLLFVVGMKLDVRLIRTTGRVALITGLGQIAFTAIVGFGLAIALGLELVTALYVGMALTFSSTIVLVKLLSDKREIDDLHGRIDVGILIVQDIVVVLAMIALTATGAGGEGGVATEVALVVLKGAALLAGVALVMRFALTPVLHRLAHSAELLVLAAIAWGIGLAALGELLGFSPEVGAFLAGVALASTPYREAIGGRLVPLRDFMLLFFFLSLGAGLDLAGVGEQLWAAIALSTFVLVGKPLIVMVIIGLMGYRKRVGFLAGVTLGQISEFSLILGALGVSLGHIDDDGLALITAVGLLTIAASTYAILYSHELYERVRDRLEVFERRREVFAGEEDEAEREPLDVVVYGLGRYGRRIADRLIETGHRVLGIDFDPPAVDSWRATGNPAAYGDLEDPELPGALSLEGVRWVVSSVPHLQANIALIQALNHHDYTGSIAVTSHHDDEAELLRERGADLVLNPFTTAAARACALLGTEQEGD